MNNCGIYNIENILNNEIYIGSAININRRFKDHKNQLKRNKHANSILQNAWNKNGEENFEFRIMRIVEEKKMLIPIEQFYLNMYVPQYNICKIAGSNLGLKFSEAAKLKIGLAKKGNKNCLGRKLSDEHKNKISIANKGKKIPEETKKKMSIASKGIKFSEDHKRKIGLANKGKKGNRLGIKLSDETKLKMSIARINYYKNTNE